MPSFFKKNILCDQNISTIKKTISESKIMNENYLNFCFLELKSIVSYTYYTLSITQVLHFNNHNKNIIKK